MFSSFKNKTKTGLKNQGWARLKPETPSWPSIRLLRVICFCFLIRGRTGWAPTWYPTMIPLLPAAFNLPYHDASPYFILPTHTNERDIIGSSFKHRSRMPAPWAVLRKVKIANLKSQMSVLCCVLLFSLGTLNSN